jgi:hypothetical protein
MLLSPPKLPNPAISTPTSLTSHMTLLLSFIDKNMPVQQYLIWKIAQVKIFTKLVVVHLLPEAGFTP